jgi:hypothetical protein
MRSQRPVWLAPGEIPADPLKDLITSNNTLSLWHIEDDRSNLERVIAAIAATCDVSSNFDFVLFDRRQVEDLAIKLEFHPGDTPDEKANASWHYDATELSASRLVNLATRMFSDKAVIERLLEKNVLALIAAAVLEQRINLAKLSQRLRAKVEPLVANRNLG